jgi:hypothetical protein
MWQWLQEAPPSTFLTARPGRRRDTQGFLPSRVLLKNFLRLIRQAGPVPDPLRDGRLRRESCGNAWMSKRAATSLIAHFKTKIMKSKPHLVLVALSLKLGVAFTAGAGAQDELDRTVLPIREPATEPITTLDAHGAPHRP